MGCIQETLGDETFNATTEYALSLGLHSNDNDFENIADLDICFKSLFKEEEKVEEKLQQITEALNKLCDVINADKKISKQIIVYSDSEISFAFLLGIILRKRKYSPIFIFKKQAWNVDNTLLSHTPANIKEQPPEIYSPEGKEVVFVFSCTPTFNFHTEYGKVSKLVESNKGNIRFLLGFSSTVISNSAHAFSVSSEIAAKINSLSSWGIDTVHLILITPKPIAGLIGYQLNTLNLKIIPYFLNKDRDTYLSVGVINNNLLR